MEKAQGALEILLLIGGGLVVVMIALLLLTSMEANTETELEDTFDAFTNLTPSLILTGGEKNIQIDNLTTFFANINSEN